MVFCQNNNLQRAKLFLEKKDYKSAETIFSKIDSSKVLESEKGLFYEVKATLENENNSIAIAFKDYILAKKYYLKYHKTTDAIDLNIKLAYLVAAVKNSPNNGTAFLNDYLHYAQSKHDTTRLAKGYCMLGSLTIGVATKEKECLAYFHKAMRFNEIAKDPKTASAINNNIAVLFNEILKKPDSAIFYLNKDLVNLKKTNNPLDLYYNYANQADAYSKLGQTQKAIDLMLVADKLEFSFSEKSYKGQIYAVLSVYYEAIKDHQKALDYFKKKYKIEEEINATKQNIAINDIQTKYKTKDLALKNLTLETKNKENRLLLYFILGCFIISLLITYFVYQNRTKRIKIANQVKQIEIQKLEKSLKDQELNEIDALLEGQEKEREKIAKDLHDNLGSLMATLKLNVEHLKFKNKATNPDDTKLFEKTEELITEAYLEIRNIAHTKNAGVIANQGLVPAIQNIVKNINFSDKIAVSFIPFGMNKRIDNALEVSIFRMIQELLTNIIKHAKATKATLQLTQHTDSINILVEDNGKGFDLDAVTNQNGMGLTQIERKVEALGGTFTIDSFPEKGTTLILDIPL